MRIICALFLAIFAFASTDANIKSNEKKLQAISKSQSAINAKLKSLGANINSKNEEIKKLEKEIQNIQKNIENNQAIFVEQEAVYNTANKQLEQLDSRFKKLSQELIDTILQDLGTLMMLNQKEPLDENTIISEEILKAMSKSAKARVDEIIVEQKAIKNDIKNAKTKIDNAKKIITSQQEKKEMLSKARDKQHELAKNLNKELESYHNELKRLDKERVGIQEILVSLNILKKQELENQEKKRKDLFKSPSSAKNLPPVEVRQIGSSYRNVSTAKYRGTKTIAPLKKYKIETKYGPYFDPVYKMRVFNEFITLSVEQKSDVLAVMAGEIVFAKDTAMLKKVVIIEHANGLHTIYSFLDSFEGGIKVGKKVKKGDVIASIERKLNFEVTQKDKHIDPLDLINVK